MDLRHLLRAAGIFAEKAMELSAGFGQITGWCPKCSTAWCYNPVNNKNSCPECDHVLAYLEVHIMKPPAYRGEGP